MRALRALVLAGAVLAGAATTAAGAPKPAGARHPDPFANLALDYTSPIPAIGGGAATLAPLAAAATGASVRDLAALRYTRPGDWGGFLAAPVGRLALGRPGGDGRSFAYLRGSGGETSGGQPVVPPPPAPRAAAGARRPRWNGCLAGCLPPPKHHHGRRRRRASLARGNCGTAGLSIRSDLPHCRIRVLNRRPGQGTFEHLTIRNTSSSRYALWFRAVGVRSPLWRDLRLGIWRRVSPPPDPLPPLGFWTTQFTRLATLAPGKSVRLTVEMYLPRGAGNAAQRLAAIVDFDWRAAAKRR